MGSIFAVGFVLGSLVKRHVKTPTTNCSLFSDFVIIIFEIRVLPFNRVASQSTIQQTVCIIHNSLTPGWFRYENDVIMKFRSVATISKEKYELLRVCVGHGARSRMNMKLRGSALYR